VQIGLWKNARYVATRFFRHSLESKSSMAIHGLADFLRLLVKVSFCLAPSFTSLISVVIVVIETLRVADKFIRCD